MPHYARWTPDEDALLATAFDSVIAKQLKRSVSSISNRRRMLKVASFSQPHRISAGNWGPTETALFLRCSNTEIAKITGRSLTEVQAKRKALHSSK